jgi:hypothetical protein
MVRPSSWTEAPLYWSTIRYLRAWWATDGVNVQRVADEGMTALLLRSIAKEYNVNRGIAAAKNSKVDLYVHGDLGTDPSATLLCRLVNEAVRNWPDGLLARAQACRDLMDKAADHQVGVPVGRTPSSDGRLSNEPPALKDLASAITKLVWFLRPHGWTIFDDLAATGLGVPDQKRRARMTAFYEKLADLRFEALVADMAQEMEARGFTPILAPRILDTVLMARSEPNGPKAQIANEAAFLSLLPPALAASVTDLALQLHDQFRSHPLIAQDTKVAA